MTPLALQLAPRGAAVAVVGRDAVPVAGDALAALGLAGDVGPGARVALCLHDPVDVIRALVALDGRVAQILLLSHAFPPAIVAALAERAGCDLLVADPDLAPEGVAARPLSDVLGEGGGCPGVETRWLMTTSGTTGLPKLVPHTLRSLSRSVYRFAAGPLPGSLPTWGLLYDPTRFAGMQVVLQALIGGGTLVVADTSAPLADQVAALARGGVTHLSATPTLWRRLLMAPGHGRLALRQATLGGEIADQPTLNALRAAYPAARVTHIYASTEAGVGFSVTDGRAGFPLAYLDAAPGGVRLEVRDDILWLRPPVSALGPGLPGIEVDGAGFVRSGDRVRRDGDRVHFLGRENGLINVGGVKVHPEAVEAVVQEVPGVALVQVSAKRSPVTGALVMAEVQLVPGADGAAVRDAIRRACDARLEREAVPAIVRFVEGFRTNAAGKLVRTEG